MLEVDCPCVTPEVVLRASGHVEKFTDLMVKDERPAPAIGTHHITPLQAAHRCPGGSRAPLSICLSGSLKREPLTAPLAELCMCRADHQLPQS